MSQESFEPEKNGRKDTAGYSIRCLIAPTSCVMIVWRENVLRDSSAHPVAPRSDMIIPTCSMVRGTNY